VFGYGKFCGVCYWIIDGLIIVKLWENKFCLLYGQILSWEDLKLHILWCILWYAFKLFLFNLFLNFVVFAIMLLTNYYSFVMFDIGGEDVDSCKEETDEGF